MSDRSAATLGRSSMELALAEVRAHNEELARLRARHEAITRRLGRGRPALRSHELTTTATEDRPTPTGDELAAREGGEPFAIGAANDHGEGSGGR